MRRHRLPAVLVPLLLAAALAGCGSDDEPEDASSPASPTPTSSTPQSGEPTRDAGQGPVAGSGAALSPAKAEQWCAAVTPEQLTALTGFEVVDVSVLGKGVSTCRAELSGFDLEISWGSESTRESQEQYAASWTRPAGVYEVTDLTLAGGQPAVAATAASPRNAAAGFVSGGRLVEARVVAFGAEDDTTGADDLAGIAEALVAVYAA
jgi:hypothetical protein